MDCGEEYLFENHIGWVSLFFTNLQCMVQVWCENMDNINSKLFEENHFKSHVVWGLGSLPYSRLKVTRPVHKAQNQQ